MLCMIKCQNKSPTWTTRFTYRCCIKYFNFGIDVAQNLNSNEDSIREKGIVVDSNTSIINLTVVIGPLFLFSIFYVKIPLRLVISLVFVCL